VHPDDVAVAIIGTVTHLRVATGTVITVDGGKHLWRPDRPAARSQAFSAVLSRGPSTGR
jgi:hypothetical protein